MSDCTIRPKLKPCSWCGAKADVLSDGTRTWGLIEHREGCLFPSYPKHEIPESDFKAWNTRYERTCHIVESSRKITLSDGTELYEDGCSICNGYVDDSDNYCPNCGARVEKVDA